MNEELLVEKLDENFNYEHFKKLSKFFNTQDEMKLMHDIYQLDLKMEVMSDYVSGKHKDKPLKDPRYGDIHEPKFKKDYLDDLHNLRLKMREALLEMHSKKKEVN